MARLARMQCNEAAIAALVLTAAVGAAALLSGPASNAPASLQATIEEVSHRWPQIAHITSEMFSALLQHNEVLVFDVREDAEYRVSHIPGAIQVAPDSTISEFLGRYGDIVNGKTVVFYCSVGMRSSQLAARVADGLKARGAEAVYDLAGGIFAWHNEGRALVDATGPTPFVHPYDASWGRLLTHQDLLRTLARR